MEVDKDRIDKSLYELSDKSQRIIDDWSEKFKEIESFRKKNNRELVYFSTLSLIEVAINSQEYFTKNCFSNISNLGFAKEFGTVKICTARGAGHTTAIAKLIKEKFNKVLIIFPQMQMSNMFMKNFPDIKDKIITCSPNCFNRLLGISDYEIVIVDCCSFLSQSKIDELYNLTIPCMKKPLYLFME